MFWPEIPFPRESFRQKKKFSKSCMTNADIGVERCSDLSTLLTKTDADAHYGLEFLSSSVFDESNIERV